MHLSPQQLRLCVQEYQGQYILKVPLSVWHACLSDSPVCLNHLSVPLTCCMSGCLTHLSVCHTYRTSDWLTHLSVCVQEHQGQYITKIHLSV